MERKESEFKSRGQIIDCFQAITCFDFENSVCCLEKHKWNLDHALQEFCTENAHKTSHINDDTDDLSTPAIRANNDRLLAEIVNAFENGTIAEKDIFNIAVMGERKRIAIVAHNNKKAELIECLKYHRDTLAEHKLYGTGTTGALVEKELKVPVTKYESGPLGGDQQLGAKIAARELDILIFFIDPLDCHPHTADIHALLRLAEVYGIVCATTAATVDFLLTSSMMTKTHTRKIQLTQIPKPK